MIKKYEYTHKFFLKKKTVAIIAIISVLCAALIIWRGAAVSQNAIYRLTERVQWHTIAYLPPSLQRQTLYRMEPGWMGDGSTISRLTLSDSDDDSYFTALPSQPNSAVEKLTRDVISALSLSTQDVPDFTRPYHWKEYTKDAGTDHLIVLYFSKNEIYLVESDV